MNELEQRVKSIIEDPQTQRRLSLRVPHLLVGNSPFGLMLVRELVAQRIDDGRIDRTRDRMRRGVHGKYREYRLSPGAKIDESREISHDIGKYEDDGRIVVCITGLDYLGLKAQDVLLKRLEETPCACFLVVQNFDGVAHTIRSRCNIFHVPHLDVEELLQLLLKHGWKKRAITVNAIQLARGDINRTLWWLNGGDCHHFVENWRQGPAVGLKYLLDYSVEISPSFLDSLFCGLKHYLAVGKKAERCLSLLTVLPRRLLGGLMSRQYLLDQYTLLVGGYYGEVILP